MPSLVAYNAKVKFTKFKVHLCIIIKYNIDTPQYFCSHENKYKGDTHALRSKLACIILQRSEEQWTPRILSENLKMLGYY